MITRTCKKILKRIILPDQTLVVRWNPCLALFSVINILHNSFFRYWIYFAWQCDCAAKIFAWNSFLSRHGCISNASLRRLMQRLRDISKRADLQISETFPVRSIKDASSETSLRKLIRARFKPKIYPGYLYKIKPS